MRSVINGSAAIFSHSFSQRITIYIEKKKRIYYLSNVKTKGQRYPSEKPLDSMIGFPNTFPLDSYLSLVDSVIYPLNNRHLRTKFDLTDVLSQNEENIYSRL